MNPEILAEWFRKQGHTVLRTRSSYWFDAAPHVYQAIPFHWVIRPGDGELHALLRRRNGIALRYSSPVDSADGRMSYHVVTEDPAYDASKLDRRVRQNVRRGLDACAVNPVPLERIADEGWGLELDTCERNGRHAACDRAAWRRRYLAAAALPGFEGWGALVGHALAASLLGVRVDDWYLLLSQQSATRFVETRAYNALAYVVTITVLRRPGIRGVFYALQSLDAPATVDEFKFRMGYVARPVRQRVVFHPAVAALISPALLRVVHDVARHVPGSRMLAKGEGLLKLSLEGRWPDAAQKLPECVLPHVTAGASGLTMAAR